MGKTKTKGTIKQKKLAKLVATTNQLSPREMMTEAGYSLTTKISQVTETEGFNMLLDRYMPIELALKTHKSVMKAKLWNPQRQRYEKDYRTRLSATELLYKVSGRMLPDNMNQVKIGDISIKVIEDKPIIRGDE